ncbi:transposase [Vibrio crassostreae]|nr:transposase [Vibrio chagasii]CAK1930201.1 transposase [Vibrio crassostreae]CAH7189880.1 transposase [Vibrio chagasii]CAK1932984.1 transposase [Vibrio crassostreae]CAK1936542.1 transposase [Vibrio crassostreae]
MDSPYRGSTTLTMVLKCIGGTMSDYSYFCGIDLAKNHFSLHAVGVEARGGAYYWTRTLNKLGHNARIMAVKYVVPYRTKGKNDLNDAVAICEASQRPSTRFVPIKSPEQQAILSVHRMREHWVREHTALINRMRALLSEFGLIIPVGRSSLMKQVPLMLEDAENELPLLARTVIADAYHHLDELNQRIVDIEQVFDSFAKVSANVQRVMKVRGIRPQTATAILTSIGNGSQFDESRDFLARLSTKAIFDGRKTSLRPDNQTRRPILTNTISSRRKDRDCQPWRQAR